MWSVWIWSVCVAFKSAATWGQQNKPEVGTVEVELMKFKLAGLERTFRSVLVNCVQFFSAGPQIVIICPCCI